MSTRIAWIGLGLIGLPMAARLAAKGRQVKGFDIINAPYGPQINRIYMVK